ncbi:acyl-CoA dehydrogenase family protein [Actinocorallia sp. B10E7]|uniref:acyl-CoA dehydrogenase family protein n=1 Tax=Actinocorallia sp. B10E7 TaxID=3153558 RepID=UPI00325CF314
MEALVQAQGVAKTLLEDAALVDHQACFPVRGLEALRESELMGLLVPERYGGLGLGLAEFAAVARELSGACLSTGLIWAMHQQQVTAISSAGEESLKDRLLPRVAAGGVYLASVTSERGKGGHLLSARQAVVQDERGLLVERDAPVVTGVSAADGFLITMRSGPDAPESSVSLVYVDRAQAEIEITGTWDPMGMRATDSRAAVIRAVVPSDQVVGGPGGFREIALHPFVTAGHIGWAACWLGAAHALFRRFVAMLRSPKHRKGFALGEDLFGVRLARVRLLLDTVSAYLARVLQEAEELDRTGRDPEDPAFQLHVNGLKVIASEQLHEAVDQLMTLVGLRHGYLRNPDFPLERVFRDLRSASMNYANDRLLVANGWLAALDREVVLL